MYTMIIIENMQTNIWLLFIQLLFTYATFWREKLHLGLNVIFILRCNIHFKCIGKLTSNVSDFNIQITEHPTTVRLLV